MAKQLLLVVTSPVDDLRKYDTFAGGSGASDQLLAQLENLMCALRGGNVNGRLAMIPSTTAAQASDTVTLSGATITGKTVTIAGVVFTSSSVAENQATNTFKTAVSATADAASLAKIINGSTSAGIKGVVTATSAAGVVTVTAVAPGTAYNAIAIVSNDATMVVATGQMTGGAGDLSTVYSQGY